MKNWITAFANHMLERDTTLATCWRIIPKTGPTIGRISGTVSLTIASVAYSPALGLEETTVQWNDTLESDSLDITGFLDTTDEILIHTGYWDGARITIFEVNYLDPPSTFATNNMNVLRDGYLGRIDVHDQRFVAEVRDRISALDIHFGAQYTITCPWVLGGAECGVNLASFTHNGTVSSVSGAPKKVFFATGLTQPPGYFSEGKITFTSGLNNGYVMDIQTWGQNKRFELERPLPYAIAPGDTFTAIRGDDHTLATCRDVFNNIQRFRGFPMLPGIDKLLENPIEWKQRPVPTPPPDGNPDNIPGEEELPPPNDDDYGE